MEQTYKDTYGSSYEGQITYFIGGYMSSRQTGHSSWSLKNIHSSRVFIAQKYCQLKSIHSSKTSKKTYFTSCENPGSSGFFGASGSMAKCSCRALNT